MHRQPRQQLAALGPGDDGRGGPRCARCPIRHARRRRAVRRWPAPRRCAGSPPAAVRIVAARRMKMDNTGFRLCGIDDDPPAALRRAGSLSSPISGRARVTTSEAIRPQESVQPTNASAAAVTGVRVVCQGNRTSKPKVVAVLCTRPVETSAGSAAPVSSVANSVVAANVPAAPPIWMGSTSADSPLEGVDDAVQPAGRLRAECGGRRVLGEGARHHGRGPVRLWRVRISVEICSASCAMSCSDDAAHAEHQAGVQDVLAGESAMDPRRDGRRRPAAAAGRPGR